MSVSEKSLEIFSLLNEEVDSRMESLLDLAKDVTSAAVRLVTLFSLKILLDHTLLIIGCLWIQNMLPGAENTKPSISRMKKRDLLLTSSLRPS